MLEGLVVVLLLLLLLFVLERGFVVTSFLPFPLCIQHFFGLVWFGLVDAIGSSWDFPLFCCCLVLFLSCFGSCSPALNWNGTICKFFLSLFFPCGLWCKILSFFVLEWDLDATSFHFPTLGWNGTLMWHPFLFLSLGLNGTSMEYPFLLCVSHEMGPQCNILSFPFLVLEWDLNVTSCLFLCLVLEWDLYIISFLGDGMGPWCNTFSFPFLSLEWDLNVTSLLFLFLVLEWDFYVISSTMFNLRMGPWCNILFSASLVLEWDISVISFPSLFVLEWGLDATSFHFLSLCWTGSLM